MKERTVISICIDLSDEMESKLLAHVHSKGNRSRYIKRLIYDDLMQVHKHITTTTHYVGDVVEDVDSMQSFF